MKTHSASKRPSIRRPALHGLACIRPGEKGGSAITPETRWLFGTLTGDGGLPELETRPLYIL